MKIPKHFHFVFGLRPQDEPFHLVYFLCLKSCMAVNQPERLTFYYHYMPHGPWWDRIAPDLELVQVDLEEFVTENPGYAQHAEGHLIRALDLNYAHQADFVRLRALIEHGGVYADMDTLFVNPIPEEFYTHEFLLGYEGMAQQEDGSVVPSLCNAMIMSQPQALFASRWLERMYKVFDGTWSRHSNQEAVALAKEIPQNIHSVPQKHFYKHSYTPQGIATLFEGLDEDFDEVYSMHLWNHLWWHPGRTDFSRFNRDLLTEEYVRNAKTTYATVARRFMPTT